MKIYVVETDQEIDRMLGLPVPLQYVDVRVLGCERLEVQAALQSLGCLRVLSLAVM